MKARSKTFFRASALLASAIMVGSATADTNTWNSGDGTWNTTAANWLSPTTWTNGNDAIFSNTATATTITLSSGLTAGAVTVGNGTNNANYTFTGSGLEASSFILKGNSANSYDYTLPTSTFNNATINVSGNLGIGRMVLSVTGNSTVIADKIGVDGVGSTAFGYLNMSGNANVTATNGVTGNTAYGFNLSGGTLTTKNLVLGGNYSNNGRLGLIYLNGTTLKPNTTDTVNSFVRVAAGTSQAFVGTGGAIFDTNGHDILVSANLRNASDITSGSNGGTTLSGTGSLTKSGSGRLVLSGANTYSGTTTVNEGTLKVTGSIGDSVVTINNAGSVLASGGTGTIGKGVTVNNGAILAAGGQNTVGTATVGSSGLIFASGSIFEWDLTSSSTSSGFDKVTSGGTIDVSTTDTVFKVILGGDALTDIQNVNNTFWNTPYVTQSWAMSDIFGQAFGSGAFQSVETSTDVSSYGSFSISGTTLTWSAVPEPSASALAGLLLTAGLLRRRRSA